MPVVPPAVAVPPPSTTPSVAAASEPTSSTAATDAVLLYPTGQPTINCIDNVQVAYNSAWENANLTISCETDQELQEWSMAEFGLLLSSGTCAVAPVQAGMQVPRFPVSCTMMLYDSRNRADSTTGGAFTMVSTEGPVSTYAMTMTTAASNPQTQSSQGATGAGTSPERKTGSLQTTNIGGPAAVSSSSSSAAAETAVSPAASSAGLSTGAKAGIAVGVILGICAILAIIFFFLRLKRRVDRMESMVKLGSTSSTGVMAPTEKPLPSAPTTGAETATPVTGGDLAESDTGGNHRNADDWRRFFGNGNNPRPRTAI